jgi:hypothetical protein
LRANLAIDVSVHDVHDPRADFMLRGITLTVKNVGTSTIWTPRAIMKVQIHGIEGDTEAPQISDWGEEHRERDDAFSVIESEETVPFFTHQKIPKAAYAVTYRAQLLCDSGDIWYSAKTVSNVAPD